MNNVEYLCVADVFRKHGQALYPVIEEAVETSVKLMSAADLQAAFFDYSSTDNAYSLVNDLTKAA